MKTMKQLLIFLLPTLMSGCAPKVITHITKSYPASVSANGVRLYGVGQEIPETAEVIGSLSVVDNGASAKCNYEQVVTLAKQETAKQGGNALALTDHRKPSILGSSCHQIAGNMLWLGDKVGDGTAFVSTDKSMVGGTSKREEPFQHSTIFANIGYAVMTSKFYLPQGTTGNPKNGLDWQLGYEWVSRSGFGAGLLYSGYKSSYAYSGMDINVGLAYIAPQFVMKQMVNRWILQENVGLGYFSYRESAEGESASLSGIGFNVNLGAEFLLSKHVGIGVNLGYIAGSLPEQEYIDYGKDEHSGIFRLCMDAGIRFHF